MRRAVLLPVLLAFFLAMPAVADAPREGLWRTAPGHLAPTLKMPFEPAVPPPMFRPDEYPAAILIRRVKGDMWTLGKLDRRLSEACQSGVFRELKPSKMIAVSSNATLGVAFGHGLGLVDPKKLADPAKVYYFYHASTPLCMVRAEDNWDPQHARSR
jgi:hypothetical protein